MLYGALLGFLIPCALCLAVPAASVISGVDEAESELASLARSHIPDVYPAALQAPSRVSGAATDDAVRPECQPIPPSRLRGFLDAIARREHLPVGLLEAVIYRESSFHPCAVSTSGAIGMMQLKPGTAADLGVTDPFDPQQNIQGGARFLRLLLDRYDGNIEPALAAYYAGPGRVDIRDPYSEVPKTRTYVSDILGLLGD
ncbi:MAG: lytic transglycosylase domain-containing protein [bacterium]|nr:lytic transglycosylase domain-containing protein [bacterium]